MQPKSMLAEESKSNASKKKQDQYEAGLFEKFNYLPKDFRKA